MDDDEAVLVRVAVPQDAPYIGEAHAEAWNRGFVDLFEPDFLALAVREKRTRWTASAIEDLSRDGSTLLVAVVAGSVVGFAHVGVDDAEARRGEVFGFYVHPDHWGTAVATELLRAAMDDLSERGLADTHLWTHEGAIRARRFYERNGWVLTERLLPYDFGDGIGSTLVEYWLSTLPTA